MISGLNAFSSSFRCIPFDPLVPWLTSSLRAFDAVMGKGGLTVPANNQKIESELKKEWNKREREARKALKNSEGRVTKRKADQVSTKINVTVTAQASNAGAVQAQTAQPSTKRPKVAKSGSAATSTSHKTALVPAARTKAKKAPATKSEKTTTAPKSVTPAGRKPAAKTPARKSRPPRSSNAEASGYLSGDPSGGYGVAPPPYSEVGPGYGPEFQSSPRRVIGLLNGRYEVDCPHLGDNFPEFGDDFGLIATLDGTKLWLKFDFGPLVGIMKIDRPYQPDENEGGTVLFWREESLVEQQDMNIDTFSRAEEANRLYFLGGGHIRGTIAYDWHVIEFDANRISGQSMTSEISRTQARAEWARRGQQNWA